MAFDPISAALGIGEVLIKRIWPDPAQQADALQKLRELEQKGELENLRADVQLALGQMEINKVEAAGGWFRAGWRPSVGWVCAAALAWTYLIQPFTISTVQIIGYYMGAQPFPIELIPELDTGTLMTLLLGMLGLGTMRTFEKYKGKD